jgi:hypothetical protein
MSLSCGVARLTGHFKIQALDSCTIVWIDLFLVHPGQQRQDGPIGTQMPDRVTKNFKIDEASIVNQSSFSVRS